MSKIWPNIKLILFVIVLVGMGVKGWGQTTGDYQPKNASGNWSDFNAWNVYNGMTWVAATTGQIPTSITSVYSKVNTTITVDNAIADCKDLIFPSSSSSKISFNPNSVLSLYGNLDFGQSASNIFSLWGTGAKLICRGAAPQSFSSFLNPNHKFIFLEINKSSSSLSFPNKDAGFENITLTAGSLIMNSGDLKGSPTATININGGTWIQTISANRINGGSNGLDLPALNINGGTMSLATTANPTGYNLGSVNITNGGTLNLENAIANINVTNTFNIDATSTLNTAMATTPSALTMSFLGTVNYNHTAVQNVVNTSYGNLGLSGGGNKILSGNLNITDDITIAGSAVLPIGALKVNIGGNWTNYGTAGFTEGSSTTSNVNFNGTGTQLITTTGGEDFFKVTKTGIGTIKQNSDVRFGSTFSELNISAGVFDAGSFTLSGTSSTALVMSGGILKLSKLFTTVPEFPSTTGYNLTGGTIELNGSGTQVLRGGEAYRNLTFSNSTNTTLISNPANITGTVYITGSALLDIGSSNGFGNINTNLAMDGGRFKMSGSSSSKPDIDGSFSLTGGVIEFAGSSAGAQPIKGQSKNDSVNIIYKNIEVTGTNVGTSNENIILNKTAGNFIIKSGATYAPNSKSILSENIANTSFVTVENGAFFKTGNNKGFSGTSYTVVSNSSIDLNIGTINLDAGSNVDYASSTVAQNISNQIPYQNLIISGITTKTAPGTLSILGNFSRTSGVFNPNIGLVSFDGTTAQIFSSANGSTNFYALRINNTGAGITINSDTLNVLDSIVLMANSKLIFGTGYLALKSDINRTAHVSAVPLSASITYPVVNPGRFIIERYLYQKKAWRFLATPIDVNTSPTITNSWRESGSTTSTGYGTQITGPIATFIGMDENTQRGSMKWYDAAIQNYKEILNTGSAIARTEGYFVFVRGDRAQNLAGVGSATTLRIQGKLNTGTQPKYNVPADKFASFGNPYASAIDFRNVTKSANMIDAFTIWNPNSTLGYYGVGAFENYIFNNGTSHYHSTPGNIIRDTIQSGEAIFIQANNTAGGSYITVGENAKVSGSRLVSRPGEQSQLGIINPALEINLHSINSNNTFSLSDGVKIDFDSAYNNGIENTDVRKVFNAINNLSILNNNYKLVVERRPHLNVTDTIFLSLTDTRVALYMLEIDPSLLGNLPLNAFLKDKFLVTEIPVSLTALTKVPFSITNDAASKVADRFMILFKQAVAEPLSVSFTNISAEKNSDKTNSVKWACTNEMNIRNYFIESSATATYFTSIGSTAVMGNSGNNHLYNFVDATPFTGINFYRVKAISANGHVEYSAIVKVADKALKPQFAVQPNPVINKTLHINFDNMQGSFTIKLVAKQGATMFSRQVKVSSACEVMIIPVKELAAGVYELLLVDRKGKKQVQTIFIQ